MAEIVIPRSVTEFGWEDSVNWFKGCINLRNVSLLAPISNIGEEMFDGCVNLENITFGVGIKKIAKNAFSCCKRLKCIHVPAKKTDYYQKRLPEELHDLIVELPAEKKKK